MPQVIAKRTSSSEISNTYKDSRRYVGDKYDIDTVPFDESNERHMKKHQHRKKDMQRRGNAFSEADKKEYLTNLDFNIDAMTLASQPAGKGKAEEGGEAGGGEAAAATKADKKEKAGKGKG